MYIFSMNYWLSLCILAGIYFECYRPSDTTAQVQVLSHKSQTEHSRRTYQCWLEDYGLGYARVRVKVMILLRFVFTALNLVNYVNNF